MTEQQRKQKYKNELNTKDREQGKEREGMMSELVSSQPVGTRTELTIIMCIYYYTGVYLSISVPKRKKVGDHQQENGHSQDNIKFHSESVNYYNATTEHFISTTSCIYYGHLWDV